MWEENGQQREGRMGGAEKAAERKRKAGRGRKESFEIFIELKTDEKK